MAGGVFTAQQFWPLPLLFPCTHPLAQAAVLTLAVLLAFQLTRFGKILPENPALTWGLTASGLLLALWLGSYPFSPLGFSTGRIPVLRGFFVTSRARPRLTVASGEVISLPAGYPAAIEPSLLTDKLECTWASLNGGSLDNPAACATVYLPPSGTYDLLKIYLQPACGLPDTSGQLKISVLP